MSIEPGPSPFPILSSLDLAGLTAAVEATVGAPPSRDYVTVLDLVRGALASSAQGLLANDPGVRLGEDPEAVHRMRVATRRLRSHLRTFRPILDPGWATALREEAGWLGSELGVVRDADVLAAGLESLAVGLPETEAPAAGRLAGLVRTQGDAGRRELVVEMASPRYARLLADLVEASNAPAVPVIVADAPASALGPLMARPWRRLDRFCGSLGRNPTDEQLHRARILAKRTRYAAEALAPAFGRRAEAFADAATKLQDVLGEHHDAVVATAWLRSTASMSDPEMAFAAGLLMAREQRTARRTASSWRSAWKELDRRSLRFWR